MKTKMKKIVKFSKPNSDIKNIKKDFVINNKKNLKGSIERFSLYKKNPVRKNCKNCNSKRLKPFIKNFSIEYLICNNCSHLNGKYQDTERFVKKLYTGNLSNSYFKVYNKDYEKRVQKIYRPKVLFLEEVLSKYMRTNSLKMKKISIIDIGSGLGHFIKALEDINIEADGFEPNGSMCKMGNKFLKKNKLMQAEIKDAYKKINMSSKYNVLSMIGVLEHLTEPHEILKKFKKSNIEFLYISVPLFSFTVFIENVFTNIFPRHLSGRHTHLYTKDSLDFLSRKYNLEIIAEWWFGTDFQDLYRSLSNSAKYTNKSMYDFQFRMKFQNLIDQFQSILDKEKLCSEVHMIFKNKNLK